MKSINVNISDIGSLETFCQRHQIKQNSNILLQIFSGQLDCDYLTNLITEIKQHLPNICIIGSTTDGEINAGEVNSASIVLSFSVFNQTQVRVFSVAKQSNSFTTGKKLIENIDDIQHAKVAIIFEDGTSTNGEHFLSAFNQFAPNLIVAGGMAGDNGAFTGTYVLTQNGIWSSAAVAAVLYGEHLQANSFVNFGWERIGKAFTVTQANENLVYRIDDMSALGFYDKYLGSDISQQLPMKGIEFPLLVVRDDMLVAREVISKNDDGSLLFAGNLNQGEQVYIGYGNIDEILNSRYQIFAQLEQVPIESMFVYSCMARRRLLKEDATLELELLSKIAPVSGFFTYGEFYSKPPKKTKMLLNQAMTVLTLSESKKRAKPLIKSCKIDSFKQNIQTIKAFTHLINATTSELNNSKKEMQKQISLIDEHIIISTLDLNGNRTYVSKAFCDISGFSKQELVGFPHAKTNVLNFSSKELNRIMHSLKPQDTWSGELHNRKKNGETYWTQTTITPNLDEQGHIISYTKIAQDITHKKIIETLSITDDLTATFNRRHFNALFPKILSEAQQHKQHIAFMFVDVDFFKQYNDTYGHQQGDKVLCEIAKLLIHTLHTIAGNAFRMGGEEFAGIFRVPSDKASHAADLARQFQQAVETLHIHHKQSQASSYLTVSIGIICKKATKITSNELYRQADVLLYQAKEQGRNRVVAQIEE